MKKIFALSSLLTIPAVAISAVSCGVSENSSITSSNVELGMSPYATTKYLSLFDTLNSDHVVNKLQKSFSEIKTSTTESKTEAEVLKWAQDTINSKTDEEIRQMLFLNAAKGASCYISSTSSTAEKEVQSFLFDIQDFSYDRVNSTFSFNYITNFYQTIYKNVMQVSYSLNYCFENIKIEITTGKAQGLILPMIKVAELQPPSASVRLIGYKNEVNNFNTSSPEIVFGENLWRNSSTVAFAAAKQLGDSLGKTGDQLIFGSMLDSFKDYQESLNTTQSVDFLSSDDECLFAAYDLKSYDYSNNKSIGNILLSEGSWEYLFGIDYWVDAQEYYKNGNIIPKGVNSSKIAVANIYFIDVDSTTKERTKWVAYTETQSSSNTNTNN